MTLAIRLMSAGAVLMACVSLSLAAPKEKNPKYTDAQQADADFAFQGEYSGNVQAKDAEVKIGVQVIAQGNGKFRAVAYKGGLPGDGWDPTSEKKTAEGSLQNGEVVFDDETGKGVVKDGVLSITTKDGNVSGKLEKVNRKSPTLGQKPPEGAVVLFDGSSVDGWKNGKMSPDGLLMQGTTSNETFGSHKLHIEFRLPYQPFDRGQGRGNSGIYVQGRYEVQMLDSFGLEGKHNECGGIYSVKDPDVNMCLPPLAWQTYDIEYTAAKFDDSGKLLENPRMSVRHNGVLVHDNVELPGDRSTTAAPSKPGPKPGPVYLQNHGCPLRYRNIWVVAKE